MLHPLPKKQSTAFQSQVRTASSASDPTASSTEKSSIQFSSTVGSKNSQKIDPFAEQNAKQIEKQKTRAKKWKKTIVISEVIGGILLVAVTTYIIMMVSGRKFEPQIQYTPEISGSSEEAILDYKSLLQQFYDQQKDEKNSINENIGNQELVNDVDQVVQNTLNTTNGKNNANAIYNAQIYFYYSNGYYQNAIDTLPKIDIEALDNKLKANIYEIAANSYTLLGDEENANKYYMLLLSTPVDGVGYGG